MRRMVAGGRSAVAWTVLALFTVLGGSSAEDPPVAPRVWTVFCAECTNNFDYKSIGVFWSHRLSGMPGGVTRLLACDETQLQQYKGLHLGNTFVHRNYGRIGHKRRVPEGETHPPTGSQESDISPSYNKPGSIMEWALHSDEAKEVDYVLYIDADMLLRMPLDPVKMGVKRGVVVSEHVGYLDVGIRAGLPAQYLPSIEAVQMAGADINNFSTPGPDGMRHAAGGWYHFFHIDDIRAIAPRWLHYEVEVRTNPQRYWSIKDDATGKLSVPQDIATGDAYVGHGQAPWIAEMYGYVFAAAEAGLRHILTEGVVVYPDEVGAARPQEAHILHYGLHCAVGPFKFTKYSFAGFDANACSGKTFGDPPAPTHLERLCAETVLSLNDAMCDFYNRPTAEGGCGHGAEKQAVCPAWEPAGPAACADQNEQCKEWAAAGECRRNAGFMEGTCPVACGACPTAATGAIPAWTRGLALAAGAPAPPLSPAPPIRLFFSDPEAAAAAHAEHYASHPHALAGEAHAAAAARARTRPAAGGEAAGGAVGSTADAGAAAGAGGSAAAAFGSVAEEALRRAGEAAVRGSKAAKGAAPSLDDGAATASARVATARRGAHGRGGRAPSIAPRDGSSGHPGLDDGDLSGLGQPADGGGGSALEAGGESSDLAEAHRLRALAARLEERVRRRHGRADGAPATAPQLVDRRLRDLLEKERTAGGGRGSGGARGQGGTAPAFSRDAAGAAGGGEPAAEDPLSTVRGVFGLVWAAMLALCAYLVYARFRKRKAKPWEAAL